MADALTKRFPSPQLVLACMNESRCMHPETRFNQGGRKKKKDEEANSDDPNGSADQEDQNDGETESTQRENRAKV